MDIFFGNFFWGILIILLGISIFLKGFGINLPLVKVFFAIIIIMFGVKLLLGGKPHIRISGNHRSNHSSMIYSNNQGEYNMVFSSGVIDLTDLQADAKNLEITVVFGSATVYLPADLNFDIDPTSVFGATVMPRRKSAAYNASSRNTQNIRIESTAVFGRLEYIYKDRDVQTENPVNPADSTLGESGF